MLIYLSIINSYCAPLRNLFSGDPDRGPVIKKGLKKSMLCLRCFDGVFMLCLCCAYFVFIFCLYCVYDVFMLGLCCVYVVFMLYSCCIVFMCCFVCVFSGVYVVFNLCCFIWNCVFAVLYLSACAAMFYF